MCVPIKQKLIKQKTYSRKLFLIIKQKDEFFINQKEEQYIESSLTKNTKREKTFNKEKNIKENVLNNYKNCAIPKRAKEEFFKPKKYFYKQLNKFKKRWL